MTAASADAAAIAAAASEQVAATPVCSILDLGRHLAAVDIAHNRHDHANLVNPGLTHQKPPVHAEAMELLYDRGQAMRRLIASMPAQTLADAAVQIAAGNSIVETLENEDLDAYTKGFCLRELHRLFLSALPVVAEAAELDPVAMGWAELLKLRARCFAGVGVQP
jgi:hypothetical protein